MNSAHTSQVTPTVIYDDISDRMSICAEIKCKPPHKSIPRPLVQRLARANMKLFLEDLDQSLRNFTYCHNTDLNSIVSLMNDLTDRLFPKKRSSRKQYKTSKNPWITPKILASIKQKNKLCTRFIKSKCSLSLANYKKIRNKVTHDKEVAKKACFENLCNNTSNSTDTWKLINRLLRKHTLKAEMPQQLKVNKKTITNPLEICNEINKHFVEVGEKLSAKVPMLNNDEQSLEGFLESGNLRPLFYNLRMNTK